MEKSNSYIDFGLYFLTLHRLFGFGCISVSVSDSVPGSGAHIRLSLQVFCIWMRSLSSDHSPVSSLRLRLRLHLHRRLWVPMAHRPPFTDRLPFPSPLSGFLPTTLIPTGNGKLPTPIAQRPMPKLPAAAANRAQTLSYMYSLRGWFYHFLYGILCAC